LITRVVQLTTGRRLSVLEPKTRNPKTTNSLPN